MSTSIDTTERTNRMWAVLVARSGAFDGHHCFLGQPLPLQLENAQQKFLALEPGERILAFLDETIGANGKGGIVLTDRALHTRQFGEGSKVMRLDHIRTFDVTFGAMNRKLLVNGSEFVSSSIAENASAVVAVHEAVVQGLGLMATVPTGLPPVPSPTVGSTGPPAAWYPDPRGRHEYRYWDGSTWSDWVADGGVQTTDPVGGDR